MTRIDIGARLKEAADQFVEAICYRQGLTVSDAFYPYDDTEGIEMCPNSDDPGCYVYATGAGEVVYVGKAPAPWKSSLVPRRAPTQRNG